MAYFLERAHFYVGLALLLHFFLNIFLFFANQCIASVSLRGAQPSSFLKAIQKPCELMAHLMINFSNNVGVFLFFFGGGGRIGRVSIFGVCCYSANTSGVKRLIIDIYFYYYYFNTLVLLAGLCKD